MTEIIRPLVTTPEPDEAPVGDFSQVLGARKWLVLLVTLVLASAAVASAYRKQTTYVSNASVLISTGAQTTVQAQQSMNTEKALAQSRAVAASVVAKLHLHDSP